MGTKENDEINSASLLQISSLESNIGNQDAKLCQLDSRLQSKEVLSLQHCLDTAHGHVLKIENKVSTGEELNKLKSSLSSLDEQLDKIKKENDEINSASLLHISSLESNIGDQDSKLSQLNSSLRTKEDLSLQHCLDTAYGHCFR